MDPLSELRRMCRRRGVPLSTGRRLLSLVVRASRASPDMRERILAVVDSALERDAQEIASREMLEEHLDHQCLVAVAHVLHRWAP